MIGKILADHWGLTEKLDGTQNETINITTKVEDSKLQQLKKDIKKCNTTAQVDVVIKEHGLSNIEGLPEHIKGLYKKGEIDKLDIEDVNKFTVSQRYNDIADQAHGIIGVKKAIDEYKDSLIKYEDGTTRASEDTKKLCEAISQSSSSLGTYLTNLNGTKAGIFSYGKSLATATIKTFALETATMAMNAAISFGVSFVISGIVTAIANYVNSIDDAIEASHESKEKIDEANNTFKAQQDLIKESGRTYAELAQHVNQLNNTNLDLKEDEYENFLQLSNQIAEQFPGLIKGYDDNGNAILNLQGTISNINTTLDDYIARAKEASQIKIVQAFKGDGDNEDYFKGAKEEVDKLNDKANNEKERQEKLEKLKETITLPDDDMTDLFGNYSSESDSRFKADYVRKYLKDSELDKRLYDDSFLFGLSKNLSTDEYIRFDNAINERDYDLDGELSDSAILTINEILSKHPKESGYNFSDYITQQIKATTDDYNQFADDVETKNKEISQNAQAVLEQSAIWDNPDTTNQMKTTMTNALVQIDWSDKQFEGFDGEQAAHYIQTTFASSFEKLSAGDKISVDKFFELNPNQTDITEYIQMYEKIKEIFEKQGIQIPIKIDNIRDVQDDFNKSLDKMSDKDKETVNKYLKDNSIDSASELEVWNKRTEGITNATDAISAYEKKAQEVSQNIAKDIKTTLSFSEAWNSIGKSGDEEADKKALEAKEKLLELAKAGKLTQQAFNNSSISKNFLKQTDLSAQEATQNINELVSSVDQLASMKSGISSISNILGEKKENISSKKTRNKGIDPDTLAGMPEDVRANTKEYEHFVKVLGDGTSRMDKCEKAANRLATAYVSSNNFLANLTVGKKNYYKSVLDGMGVENSAEIVEKTLMASRQAQEYKTKALAAVTQDMGKETSTATDKLLEHAEMSNLAKVKLVDLIAAEKIFESDTLSTSDKVTELNKLAMSYLGVSNAIQISSAMGADSRYWNSQEDYDKAVAKQWNKTIKKQTKLVVTGVDVKAEKSSGNSGSGKGKKDKSAKQQFDWINRALDRLSSRLDLVKTQYDNLFNNKKAKDSNSLLTLQNKNLDDQYKLLKKTAKYQGKAQKKYTKKSKKVRISKNKKENASLKKAVRQGRIKGNMKDLIATYGEKKATKIQKYQDWYDKAREAEKNKISAQKSRRENRIQKYQGIVDNADEKRSLAQAQKENATTATSKNNFIEKEKESVEASYNNQIKIANLKRDSLKADQLRAEKAKELRDLDIEHHQNLADEHQSILDQYNAEKELATKASEKNTIIAQEEAKTRELYAEKITIAGLEGNSSEQKQLQAELSKQLRDFDVERHQNLADEIQAELDKSSAEKENLTTANEKNAFVDREKALTQQLYAEKIAIAHIEGKSSEEQQLQEELARQMVVAEKEKFDNIAHYYENLVKLKNNSYKNLSNAVDEIEARGLIVAASLYTSQIQLNDEKKAGYKEELKELEAQLPYIKEGTDEWYEAQDAIQSCKDGIAETTKNTIELNKAIREIPFLLNEKISTRLDLVSSEFELINKFMSNKKMFDDKTGNFTKEGTATLAAYYNQLLLAQEKTKDAKTAVDDMLTAIERGDEGYEDKELAMQEYYERYDEYLKLAGTELDIQQKLIDMMKEKYQAELDHLKDIIDKRKELLDTEKEAYDYQKSIEEKTKNIGSLAKQLEASKGDDSEAGKLKLQQLQVSLDEARQDLQDTEYDKWISDQKEMLDKLYNDYSAFIDDKLNDTDSLLQEAIEYLEDPATKKEFLDTWDTYMNRHDFDPENDLTLILNEIGKDGSIVSAINNLSNVVSYYYELQQKTSGVKSNDATSGNNDNAIVDSPPPVQSYPAPSQDTPVQTPVEYVTDPATTFQNAAQNKILPGYIKSLVDKYSKKAGQKRNKYGLLNQHIYDKTKGYIVPNEYFGNLAMGLGLPKTATQSQILQVMKNAGYSTGGFVETLQKIPAINGDDGWATLKRGEAVLTPEQTKQFQKLAQNLDVLNSAVNILPNLQKHSYNFVPNHNITQSFGDINIEMDFPNVTNYEEFRQKMQLDPKIETYVKSIIWDKGALSKYKTKM